MERQGKATAETLIHTTKAGDEDTPASSHEEALLHVNRHRDLFEHYARGAIHIEPAPEGLNTFAFDLKTNTIYVNSRFYRQLGFSEEKTTFATLHEIEHFQEKLQMIKEEGGEKAFDRYVDRIGNDKAYALTDNCVADVRENRSVVARTHQGFRDIEESCYKEDLFKETDFTSAPMHIKLQQALLREARVSNEECKVSPEVREKINAFRAISKNGVNLFDLMTHPNTPMSMRLRLQDKFLWPLVKELRDEDIKRKQEKNKEANQEKQNEGGPTKEGKADKASPDEIFKDFYDEAGKRVPNAVPIESLKKSFKEWQKDKAKESPDKSDEEYAKKLGVKNSELKQYRDIVKALKQIENPETSKDVLEELRDLFAKIISKRTKRQFTPKYPVEEGEELIEPADMISQTKAGNLEPKVWETYEIKERKGHKFGEVEITLVCDRSGSMEGEKLLEQRKAAVLMMEALNELSLLCDEAKMDADKPLEVKSEIYAFSADANDGVPLKELSKDLGEKERIKTSSILSTAPGSSTTDFVTLESIANNIRNETKQKILEGELKKIVIVFTDGGSSDKGKVKQSLESLRKEGVIVVCIGITESAKEALDTYAPNARLAETAERLPIVLFELLKEHLSGI